MVQLPVVACGVNRRLIIEREGMTYGLFDAFVAPAFSAHGDKMCIRDRYMLALKYIETLRDMTSGQDNKTVYIPYEASGVLSSIGAIKEMFNK